MHELNQVEMDFIEFIAQRGHESLNDVKKIFLETKDHFNFKGDCYKNLCGENYKLFRILYNDNDSKKTLDSYRFHALMHIYRFISYSYPTLLREKIIYFVKHPFNFFKNIIKKFSSFFSSSFISKKELNKKQLLMSSYNDIARSLVALSVDSPRVIDYGCGLGYVSFEIGKIKNSKIYLVDIQSLVSDFVQFRFKKHGIDFEFIPVTKDNLYPELPLCDICIAKDVMEHLHSPISAFQKINQSLKSGGILYGDFGRHERFIFHVSPNLDDLDKETHKYFDKIIKHVFRKK